MRQRLVNEKAAAKTLAFLKELYNWCQHVDVFKMSDLTKKHGLSTSTGSACLKLNIIEKTKDAYRWISEEPNRECALQVLEVLRLRNDKMVSIPLEGFESMVDELKQLVIALKPRSDASRQVGNYKESFEREQRETFVKIVAGLCSSYPLDAISKEPESYRAKRIENTNDTLLNVASGLLAKIYNGK